VALDDWNADMLPPANKRSAADADIRHQCRSADLLLKYAGGSVAKHQQGVQDYIRFGEALGEAVLPGTERQLLLYLAYSTLERGRTLDSSTVESHVNSVNLWHAEASRELGVALAAPGKSKEARRVLRILKKRFKKADQKKREWTMAEMKGMLERGFRDTRSGRHQRINLLVNTLFVIRPDAAAHIVVKYVVTEGGVEFLADSELQMLKVESGRALAVGFTKDKNVHGGRWRWSVVPEAIPNLGVRPIDEILRYLVEEQPPSGGYLLAAPIGNAKVFRRTAYTGSCAAFQKAYLRAWPGRTDVDTIGAQSCRKSMASWLWWDGRSKRNIADQGGWSLHSRKDAVDVYFKTSVPVLLRMLTDLGVAHQRTWQAGRD